jgi:pimeloyl-ACP methyl ester carboxylesterase
MYKFTRVDKDGRILPDADDVIVDDDKGSKKTKENDVDDVEESKHAEDEDVIDEDDSDLGTFEIDTKKVLSSGGNTTTTATANNGNANNNNSSTVKDLSASDISNARKLQRKQREEHQQRQRDAASQDPIVAMTERSKRLRHRAKHRVKVDTNDAKIGVTYQFTPNTILLGGSAPSYNGTIHAMKIGPQKKTGTYIAALLYKLPPAETTLSTKTIVYSHGNATDIGAMAGLQCILSKNCKCHVLVYDYSGYGESGGIPMEANTYRDIKMIYEYVVSNVALTNGDESNIILYGQSVGSGPSCYLASKRPNVGGLVLHSPFTSGMRVLTPSRALACLDIFPNIDRIRNVKCPVFIIHGRNDKEVGFEHGLALQSAVPVNCQTDPWWVPDKGHNDIVDGSGIVEYIRKMKKFIQSLD